MSRFDDYRSAVRDGAEDLAKKLFRGLEQQAAYDAGDFLERTGAKLRRWRRQLADAELTRAEFEDLVRHQSDLADLGALTAAGVAAEKLERFRRGLIDLVIVSALDVLDGKTDDTGPRISD